MLKLLLIRHGESTGNRERRMTGHQHDRLTADGQAQCQRLGQWLHHRGWQPSHIYSSPLRRAVESVEILMHPWGWQLAQPAIAAQGDVEQSELRLIPLAASRQAIPQVFLAPNLREFDAGILTGLTWAEAQRRHPKLCQALLSSPEWVPIPQAETPAGGRDRAAAFISQLLDRHSNHDAVWLMSHQWILEHLVASLMGCDRTWKIAIANTALFEFWLDRDRWSSSEIQRGISDLWQIKRFGEIPHLTSHSHFLSEQTPTQYVQTSSKN